MRWYIKKSLFISHEFFSLPQILVRICKINQRNAKKPKNKKARRIKISFSIEIKIKSSLGRKRAFLVNLVSSSLPSTTNKVLQPGRQPNSSNENDLFSHIPFILGTLLHRFACCCKYLASP